MPESGSNFEDEARNLSGAETEPRKLKPQKSNVWKKLVLWTSVLGAMAAAGEKFYKQSSSALEKQPAPIGKKIISTPEETKGKDFEIFLHSLEDKEYLQEALQELKDLQKLLEVQNLTQEYALGSSGSKKFDGLVEKELERIKKQLHHDPFWYDRLFQNTGKRLLLLVEEGLKAKVPLGVMLGIAIEESLVDQEKQSPSGKAIGIMQLEKPTAEEWQRFRLEAESFNEKDLAEEDLRKLVVHNIGIGAAGLHHLHELFGRWDLATLAFNNGRTATHRRLERLAKDKPGVAATYLDLLPYLPEKTNKGKINPHRGYPVRVEAKLQLFQEYYLPKLIANLEEQLAK